LKYKPLKEVKEYNYLGNTIDYKGNFKRCIQELAKKGLKKVLFSLRKLFSNFEHLPVNLSCKLFDTLIRPDNGKRHSSALETILLAVFLSPKMILQYLV
jgi:hypothetical protein